MARRSLLHEVAVASLLSLRPVVHRLLRLIAAASGVSFGIAFALGHGSFHLAAARLLLGATVAAIALRWLYDGIVLTLAGRDVILVD